MKAIIFNDGELAVFGQTEEELLAKLADLDVTEIDGDWWRYFDGEGGQLLEITYQGELI